MANKVMFVPMETYGISDLNGSNAPYIVNTLVATYAWSTVISLGHNSAPNYVEFYTGINCHDPKIAPNVYTTGATNPDYDSMTVGDTPDSTSTSRWNGTGGSIRNNIFDLCAAASPSLKFKGYYDTSFASYRDIRTYQSRITGSPLNLPTLSATTDAVSGAGTLTAIVPADLDSFNPDFCFVQPSNGRNMHDSGIASGNTWLAAFIPAVQASNWYKNGGTIVICWDEQDGYGGDSTTAAWQASGGDARNGGAGGTVYAIYVSNFARGLGQQAGTLSTAGVLATITDGLSLGRLGISSYAKSVPVFSTTTTGGGGGTGTGGGGGSTIQPTPPALSGTVWTLVKDAEFTGPTLDLANWSVGDIFNGGTGAGGTGNVGPVNAQGAPPAGMYYDASSVLFGPKGLYLRRQPATGGPYTYTDQVSSTPQNSSQFPGLPVCAGAITSGGLWTINPRGIGQPLQPSGWGGGQARPTAYGTPLTPLSSNPTMVFELGWKTFNGNGSGWDWPGLLSYNDGNFSNTFVGGNQGFPGGDLLEIDWLEFPDCEFRFHGPPAGATLGVETPTGANGESITGGTTQATSQVNIITFAIRCASPTDSYVHAYLNGVLVAATSNLSAANVWQQFQLPYYIILSYGSNSKTLGVGGDLICSYFRVWIAGTTGSPIVATSPATAVTATGAVLNGSVNPDGSATTYHFDLGPTTNYGTKIPTPDASAGSGTSAVAETSSVAGLSPSTTYHYRITATNPVGTSNGNDVTFTTPASGGGGGTSTKPTVTTGAATSVAPTSAVINGTSDPDGADTLVYCQYGTNAGSGIAIDSSSPATAFANDTVVTTAQFQPPSNALLVALCACGEFAANAVSGTVTDDQSNTWTQKVQAHTAAGTGSAEIWTLQLGANPPAMSVTLTNSDSVGQGNELQVLVITGAATSQSGAATASQNASSSTTLALAASTAGSLIVGALMDAVSNNEGLVELANTSAFDINADAATGETYATFQSAVVAPNTTSQTYGFTNTGGDTGVNMVLLEILAGPSYTNTTTPVDVGSGTATVAAQFTLTGLTTGTTYHYRLYAVNSNGTTVGADNSFTTTSTAPPTVTTGAATVVAATTATLNATVNPNGLDTGVTFQFGLTTGYGTTTSPAVDAGAGSGAVSISVPIGSLTPGTLYHYRAVGTNSGGTTNGTDHTFTTPAVAAPGASTGLTSGVGPTSATLSGTVTPNGADTTYYFEFGPTNAYGTQTTPQDLGAGAAALVAATINGLASGTLYHYRIVASSANGTTDGADQTFTTATLEPLTSLFGILVDHQFPGE